MEVSPAQAAIEKIESQFLPYQRRLIQDTSRFVAVPKAVRTGVTYCHSYKSSRKRVLRHPDLPKTTELFASKNKTVATEYTRYHRAWAELWNAIWPGLIDLSTWTTEICRYPGGDIYILSSDPNSFRGMEGDVTLDEVAHHDQQDALFAAAQSRIQWLKDGQVTLISSHSHPETTFNRLVGEWTKKNDGVHSVHQITIHDAVKEGLARKVWAHRLHEFKSGEELDKAFVKSIRDTCLSAEDFAREYECRPAALSELIFPEVYDDLALEEVPDVLDHSVAWGDLYVGVDCGRAKDLTVAWALQQGYDSVGMTCYRTVAVNALTGMPFGAQLSNLRPIVTNPYITGGFIDQGTQGKALADMLWDETGDTITPIGMGSKNKGEMAELLRAFAQTQRITFPKNAPRIKQSMCCVRRVPTLHGNVKYEGSTSFDHGDYFWACALALYAAEGERKGRLMLPGHTTANAA